MKILPSDFHICPICRSLIEEFYCGHCRAITIIPWFLLGVPK